MWEQIDHVAFIQYKLLPLDSLHISRDLVDLFISPALR